MMMMTGSLVMGLGGLQLGIMAACVVLFVPMGMAGWHLSRNKILFFGAALFITLAVGVHLSPYFPSVSDFISSPASSSTASSSIDLSCFSLLHRILWFNNTSSSSWRWDSSSPVSDCGFQRVGPSDTSDLLNGSWVLFAGDSQARLVALSLLTLVIDSDKIDSVRADLFKRHSDYHVLVAESGLKLDFIWAPYVANLTELVGKLEDGTSYPDVLVMGSGLWDMLHIHNASDYGASLSSIRTALASSLAFITGDNGPVTGTTSIRSPHRFWIGMPWLVNSMLNTEEKREKLSGVAFHEYDREIQESRILRQSGGPFALLDIRSLCQGCGETCTADGMHYEGAVYDAAVQVLLNALLIESHQRI
ncbi:hypothetical protein MLD38_022857 [Melastoma candidum]|uniref:Uncharacterized protein n=1 Tax=Melastoma candidum TaxID=119954 RepID=A0ACB9QKJ5_9MYRT|nr:hypothetical protein MLD38_022857 [Melastoma candidum]